MSTTEYIYDYSIWYQNDSSENTVGMMLVQTIDYQIDFLNNSLTTADLDYSKKTVQTCDAVTFFDLFKNIIYWRSVWNNYGNPNSNSYLQGLELFEQDTIFVKSIHYQTRPPNTNTDTWTEVVIGFNYSIVTMIISVYNTAQDAWADPYNYLQNCQQSSFSNLSFWVWDIYTHSEDYLTNHLQSSEGKPTDILEQTSDLDVPQSAEVAPSSVIKDTQDFAVSYMSLLMVSEVVPPNQNLGIDLIWFNLTISIGGIYLIIMKYRRNI